MLSRTVTCPVHAIVNGEAKLGGEARITFDTDQSPSGGEVKRFVTFEVGTTDAATSMRFTVEDLREVLRESDHVSGVA